MGDTMGAVLGPALALILLTMLAGHEATQDTYRQIFLLTLIPGILSAISFLTLVKEQSNNGLINKKSLVSSVQAMPLKFRFYLIGVGLFGIGDFAHSLLTLRAAEILTPTMGATAAGQTAILLYVVHNILYAGMSFPIGALADRSGQAGPIGCRLCTRCSDGHRLDRGHAIRVVLRTALRLRRGLHCG